MYDSISYFNNNNSNNKTENEIFKIISPDKFLKSFGSGDINKDSLSFQLTSIRGNLPTLKDKNIHNLTLTGIGRKKNYQCRNQLKQS